VGETTQKIKTYFCIRQVVFMWNETGMGVHDHDSLFRQ